MKYLIYLVIFLFVHNFKAQSGLIHYTIKDVNNRTSEKAKQVNKELELMELTLIYDENTSNFYKEKYIPLDRSISNIASILIGTPNLYVQNSILKLSYRNVDVADTTYILDHSYKNTDWEISGEHITINTYTCYKASRKEYNSRTGKTSAVIAWFTPDIPVSFGPAGYGGLPGVILQLQYNSFVYKATKIKLNPEKTVKLTELEPGKIITTEEFVSLSRQNRRVLD